MYMDPSVPPCAAEACRETSGKLPPYGVFDGAAFVGAFASLSHAEKAAETLANRKGKVHMIVGLNVRSYAIPDAMMGEVTKCP